MNVPRPGIVRVLIADSHELILRGLRRLLEREPDLQLIDAVMKEEDAFRRAVELAPDVLITALRLAEGRGIRLVRRVKSASPAVRILVLTSFDHRLYAEQVLREGALGFVSKQEPADVVVRAIRMAIQGRIYVEEDCARQLLPRLRQDGGRGWRPPRDVLSNRELQVFQLLGRGLSPRQIALDLKLAQSTIETYQGRIRDKLQLANQVELMRQAVHAELESDDLMESSEAGAGMA
jgi:DNA-binding NarL/FixJ family response regulator